MNDFRVYKGVAKYTAAFKVPAQPNTTDGINCDSLFDSPTNFEKSGENSRGNYCTMSPYDNKGCTVSNGNLEIQTGSSKCGRGTFWASSGKWYFEFEMTQYGNPYVGIASVGDLTHYAPANAIMVNNNGVIYHQTEGNHQSAGRSRSINATGSYMCAFDLDNNKIWWGKDGTWYQFTASSSNTTTTLANVEAGNHAHSFAGHPQSGNIWTIAFGSSTNACTYKINTGQRPYKYPDSIPSGYKSLCTGNLEDPPIEDGSKHFDATLYTGNGGTKTVSGLEFEGDFFWLKSRSNGHDHWVFDRNRGLTKAIYPNGNSAEYDYSPNGISATSSTGFTLNGSQTFNSNTHTYVGWVWNAGDFNTNSAYNQSAVWSQMCSPAPSIHTFVNGFDGNLNTVFAGGISANSYFTFTPTGGLSFTNSVRVRNGGVGGASYKYNNGSAYSLPANAWTTVASGGGTMTSLAVTRNSTDVHGWYAIEVDGKILVDRGLIGTGSLNSTNYNTDRMWSDGITNGNSEFDQNKTNAFNGNRSNKARTGGNAVTVTINFSPALAVSNTIEILGEQWATADFQYTATVGGTTTTQNVIGAPCVFNVSGNLTQITIRSNNSQSRTCLEYIKVDGKELINSDTTPPNFPAISGAVQANPTAGISVVKYVGNGTNKSSIPHGLGKEPEFIIAKNLDTGYSWAVYTKATSPAGWLKLDLANSYTGSTGIWGNTYPDSNVFYVGGDGELNQSGKEFIAYCFAQTPGFLATGRYDGHVSGAERPVITTGFRPRFVMIKSYSHGTEWRIFDTERDPDNTTTQQLFPDTPASETAAEGGIDIYSNGFRVRDTSTGLNTSGVDYVYLAFAEHPFKIARAR